jgi:hypothetical protein
MSAADKCAKCGHDWQLCADATLELAKQRDDARLQISALLMTHTAWLIEWPAADTPVARWWHPKTGWSNDANQAIRYARKEDAEAVIETGKFCAGMIATEHQWIAALSTTDAQPQANQSASGWWCPECETHVPGEHVTFHELHDTRAGGCGCSVYPERPKATEPDPRDERIKELTTFAARLLWWRQNDGQSDLFAQNVVTQHAYLDEVEEAVGATLSKRGAA